MSIEEIYEIIRDGRKLINDYELKIEWKYWVKESLYDEYDMCILKTTIESLKMLNQGVNYEEIIEHFRSKNLTSHMKDKVTKAISHFSETGKDFESFWINESMVYSDNIELKLKK